MKGKLRAILSALVLGLILFFLLVAVSRGQTAEILASGGAFTLEKSALAGGGNTKAGVQMGDSGTAGQAAAGLRSSGGQFSIYSGFWTPDDFTPTAAAVGAGGCVKTADGRGIRNARVTIRYPDGQTRTTLTGTFGCYRFTDIPIGEIYVFSVVSKRFTFNRPAEIRTILDDTQDIDFVADEAEANAARGTSQ
ncbi:MAG: carboxypeptidase regulatory-like domain-containing protein [Acidobacteria bacterium]|nr:carboxypeptidase regulatory-like domain-containing protein [Acidobacteriota bacterium]